MAGVPRVVVLWIALTSFLSSFPSCLSVRARGVTQSVAVPWIIPYNKKYQNVSIRKGQKVLLYWSHSILAQNVYKFPTKSNWLACTVRKPSHGNAPELNVSGSFFGQFAIPWVAKGYVGYYGCIMKGEVIRSSATHCQNGQKIAVTNI